MKNIKSIILVICSVFLLTGCSVEYNLNLEDNTFKETMKIGSFNSNGIEGFEFLEPIAYNDKYDSMGYYETVYKNGYMDLSYDYSFSEFRLSSVINECFDVAGVTKDVTEGEEKIQILTSGGFKCLNYGDNVADRVTINFKTNHKVIEHNADKENAGVYTWVFDSSNYQNKNIRMIVDNSSDDMSDDINTAVADRNDTLLLIGGIIGGILLLALVVAIVIKIFGKANNRV